jgi:hypothetical protein
MPVSWSCPSPEYSLMTSPSPSPAPAGSGAAFDAPPVLDCARIEAEFGLGRLLSVSPLAGGFPGSDCLAGLIRDLTTGSQRFAELWASGTELPGHPDLPAAGGDLDGRKPGKRHRLGELVR